MRFSHVKHKCGGDIGSYDRGSTFMCGKCKEKINLSTIKYDEICINNMTGWVFPVIYHPEEKPIKKDNYTYILECSDGTFYTGWTNDLDNRLKVHNEGKGAKYTRTRLPVKLVYYELHATQSDAMRREYQIKQMSRKEKIRLIESCGVL